MASLSVETVGIQVSHDGGDVLRPKEQYCSLWVVLKCLPDENQLNVHRVIQLHSYVDQCRRLLQRTCHPRLRVRLDFVHHPKTNQL